MAKNRTTVVGVFDARDRAERAVADLEAAGFRRDQIGIAVRDGENTGTMATTDAGSGAGRGAAAGAVLGGLLGAAAALLIPGVGPVLAIGTLGGTVLAGAAAGAGLGALAGALVGMGVPEEEARYYQGEFEAGRAIVTVDAGRRVADAQAILRDAGGYDVGTRDRAGTAGASVATERWDDARPHYRDRWQARHGASGGRFEDVEPAYRYAHDMRGRPEFRDRSFDRAEADLRTDWEARHEDRSWADAREHVREGWDQTLTLREEQLVANKERVQTGRVEVGKRVVEEQTTVEVPVTREEVVIERRPVNRPSDEPIGRDSRTIEVPVTEERVNVEKQTVVREEIGVQKRVEQDTVPVSGTVRREEAVVNRTGAAGAADARTWDEAMPRYRSRWQQRWGQAGQERWEDWEPRYRFGWEMAHQPAYRGRAWTEVESQARKDWEANHRGSPWDKAKEGVRDAWEAVTGTQVRR